MKIKLAILDRDAQYISRFINAISSKYSEEVEVSGFTDPERMLAALDQLKIDVLLADDYFKLELNNISDKCSFAYFVSSSESGLLNDYLAIGKFQKTEQIYKQILGLYAEKAAYVDSKVREGAASVIAFMPVSGGSGASTMAAACAMYFAAQGKRVLYLNFEAYGSSDLFFRGDGSADMSDVIYALKSRKTNLVIRLESLVKQDQSGVFFFSESKSALDMTEFTEDDREMLIHELQMSGSYDYIILDMDFSLQKSILKFLENVHRVVLVGDGHMISNRKLSRVCECLKILDVDSGKRILDHFCIIYNKFSNKDSKLIETPLQYVGGAVRYEHYPVNVILQELSKMKMFEDILRGAAK